MWVFLLTLGLAQRGTCLAAEPSRLAADDLGSSRSPARTAHATRDVVYTTARPTPEMSRCCHASGCPEVGARAVQVPYTNNASALVAQRIAHVTTDRCSIHDVLNSENPDHLLTVFAESDA